MCPSLSRHYLFAWVSVCLCVEDLTVRMGVMRMTKTAERMLITLVIVTDIVTVVMMTIRVAATSMLVMLATLTTASTTVLMIPMTLTMLLAAKPMMAMVMFCTLKAS